MQITNASLHHIDHHNNQVNVKDIEQAGKRLNEYVDRLLVEISESSRKRDFRFRSDNTEVRAALPLMFEDSFAEQAETVASRLLSKEIEAQAKIDKLGIEIQKGSLFQATIMKDGNKGVVISKADHSTILDEDDFELHRGLPWDKRTFKAVLAMFVDERVDTVAVYDTNPEMTRYWWYDFLELDQIYDDIQNTKRSIESIEQRVLAPIKNNFRTDFNILRNSMIGYFRTKPEFEVEDFINTILDPYRPHDRHLPKASMVGKLRALPERHKFDPRFTISPDNINKRITNQVFPLRTNLDLVLKGFCAKSNRYCNARY